MANGLRKLIKRARKQFTNNSNRRFDVNRFGPRLKVEELEERIAPAVLASGEYLIYDTADGPEILWNSGATDVSVVVTDGGGATDLDTMVIDLDTGGAVALQSSGPLTGTGGVLVTNSNGVATLTLTTGDDTTDLATNIANATYWSGAQDATLDVATDPAESTNAFTGLASDADVTPSGSDVIGSMTLDQTGSDLTLLNIQAIAAGDAGDFTGAMTVDDDVVAVTIAGTATGAWGIGDDVTGNVSIGTGAATTDITIGGNLGDGADTFVVTTGAMAGDITITGDFNAAASIDVQTTSLTGNVTATGALAGDITAQTGISGNIEGDDIDGTITADTGNISGTITTTGATTDGVINAVVATTGNISGNITTSDGDANTDLANVANITATAGAISSVMVIDGDLTNLDAGGAVSGAISVDGTIAALDIGGTLASAIIAEDGFTDGVDRTIDGGVTAAGNLVATTTGFVDAANNNTITIGGVGLLGAITATAGDIGNIITISAGGIGATGSITASDAAADVNGAVNVTGGVVAGATISAGTNVAGAITIATGDFGGTVTASAGLIGAVTLTDVTASAADGSITVDASFTAGTTVGALTSDGDFAGDVNAQGGGITGIASTDGDITSTSIIQSAGTIGYLRADINEDVSGEIAATVTTSAGDITEINAGGDISGTFTATGNVVAVTTDGQLTGVITGGTGVTGVVQIDLGITAAGEIHASTGDISGGVTITEGGMAGLIKADAGNINTAAITINDGGLVAGGTIEAGTDIDSAIDINDNGAGVGIAGTIKADANIDGAITVAEGGIAATGIIQAGNNIGAGGIAIANGGIDAAATITAGADIDGNVVATTGNIAANITAAVNIDGDVIADAGAISGTVKATAGDLTGTVRADAGNITQITVGGDIAAATIQAEDDITAIDVTGAITGGTVITASFNDIDGTGNIDEVTAGGGINVDMDAINIGTVRSGGLVGNDIAGDIDATMDIDLIDAGAADITATVTAGVADGNSPLATFISGGYSFAVWAITPPVPAAPTEPTAAAVTAQLDFDGGAGTLDISGLSGVNASDLYITTRADTGSEQLFHDPDVDVYDAPVTITIGADAPITFGTIYAEGTYVNIGGDTDITATSVVVEGGAGGTISVAVGEDISFGWIAADLDINVTGSGKAGDLVLGGNAAPGTGAGVAVLNGVTVTVDGSLTDIYLGDAAAGLQGDLGTNAGLATIDTLTNGGSIDNIYIDGDVYGSIRATQIGDIEVGGNVGGNIAANIGITGRDGIGDIKVDGTIGGDAAQTVTIQATAATANIGRIDAVGAIGESAGAAGVVTIAAGNNIASVESVDDIGDANSAVVISATNGTIGDITAGGPYGINGTITAGGTITSVSTTDVTDNEGAIAGAILSHNGDITNVNTIGADITANVTATNGNIGGVNVLNPAGETDRIDEGDVTGNITAGLDIGSVTGEDITGMIIAGAASAASPFAMFTYGGYNGTTDSVIFTADAATGALYGYTFDANNQEISITIDNWDGAAVRATGAIDLSLTTNDSLTGDSYDAPFELLALDFTAASIANAADLLGTVTVEGPVGVLDTGTLGALIVEGNVTGPIWVADSDATSPVTGFAAALVTGVADPTLAQMEGVFADPDGGSVVFGAPADPTTFNVPASNTGGEVSFAFGTAAGLAGIGGAALELGDDLAAGEVEDYAITVAGGLITEINGSAPGVGDIDIDGDLDYPITMQFIDDVNISGSLTATGSIAANNIEDIIIGTTVASYIAQNGEFADAAAAQTWLDGNGDMAGTITSTEVVENGAVVGIAAGDIGIVTIRGDFTGSISADGAVGAVNVGQSLAQVDGTKIAQTGNMTGTLDVGGNLASLTAELDVVGAASSYIAVGGNSGAIISTDGNIGGSGLIMVGGSLININAVAGNVAADIFIGGAALGADSVVISGLAITGDMAIGTVNGVDQVTLNIDADPADADPITYDIAAAVGAGMMVEIGSGDITTSGATVDRITLIEDSATLNLTTDTAGNINVDEIIVLDATPAAMNMTVEGDVGTIVASYDITTAADNTAGKDSSGVQSIFLSNYNAAEGTALALDVIANVAPTALDDVLNTTGNIDFDLDTLNADNLTGGVIASGDLVIGDNGAVNMDVESFGYMVSLNGTLTVDIYANEFIGDAAASADVDVDFQTEGFAALGYDADANGTIDMQDDVAAFGLEGLPNWFAGGILSEMGNVNVDVDADGNAGTVLGIVVAGDDALGMIYAKLGEVTGFIDLGGNWGGVQAPIGNINGLVVDMPLDGSIDYVIAPQTAANFGGAGDCPNPTILLVNDEIIVTAGNSYEVSNGEFEVSVTGAGTLIWVEGTPGDEGEGGDIVGADFDIHVFDGLAANATVDVTGGSINDVTILGDMAAGSEFNIADGLDELWLLGDMAGTAEINIGNDVDDLYFGGNLDAGSEVTVQGDGGDLTVNGNWAGAVSFLGNALSGALGEIEWVTVQGDIDGATADLTVHNFDGFTHNGTVTSGGDQFVEDAVLDLNGRRVTWTNMAGDDQTLYLGGSPLVSAEYDTFFGKLTEVDIVGRGVASIASVNADNTVTELQLRAMLTNVAVGNIPTDDDATAHVGNIVSNDWGSNVLIYGALVNGDLGMLDADGMAMNLAVTGNAGIMDVTRMINNSFIGGNVGDLHSDRIMGTTVMGNVDEFHSIFAMNTRIGNGVTTRMSGNIFVGVSVSGVVANLSMGGGATAGAGTVVGSGWGIPALLINSKFGFVAADNIDNRPWIEAADPNATGSDAVERPFNPAYNPCLVINTNAPGLTLFA